MPGIVAFRRRWSVGSDDFIVPGIFLLVVHLIWIAILVIVLLVLNFDESQHCTKLLLYYKIGYLCVLIVSTIVELVICIVSMRGSILNTAPRESMKIWLYIKFVIMLIDISWLVIGIIWLKEFYLTCPAGESKEIMLGLVISNWLVVITIIMTIWCTFDAAGRSWVKMKKYQRSMRESESRFNYKRSGSRNRNWRQRKVIRAYQDSWDHRCRLLFCCMGTSERNRNSFADIARLLSDFFRDLDVVPSDVIAGLVLLRKFQKLKQDAIVRQKKNGIYEFLSGVAITEQTQFLALNDQRDYDLFQNVIHYMHYALGVYGWPIFLMTYSKTGICKLVPELRCCFCCKGKESAEIIEDNCCYCNYAALKKMLRLGEVDIIYTTYHVDVGETPFFVAVDYAKKKIVISIRGTLSLKDVLTDLNAEGDCLPLDPPKEDWIGHKGMVQAAVYIKNKLEEENLIERALQHNPERDTHNFGLVLLGHSLGAGAAAILAILLKPQYPSLVCYSYSPPGGLLSMPAVEYSKSFIISVVVGKDAVPRIGLHQMEAMRADLINAIKRSIDPKWKTIACSVICCCCGPEPTSVSVMSSKDSNVDAYEEQRESARQTSHHPNDNSIALTLHRPLYPPGKIIHIVRHHQSASDQMLKKREPVYQAIWANTTDFDEVLISPVMIQDHMPDKVFAALNKVVTTIGPRKPQRQTSNTNSIAMDAVDSRRPSVNSSQAHISPQTNSKIFHETSFASLQSPHETNVCESSKTSSLAGSFFGGKSQLSEILQYDISSNGGAISPSGPSDATTIVAAESYVKSGKSVAFDVAERPTTLGTSNTHFDFRTTSPSQFGHPPKSILHRETPNQHPSSKKLDLIHDDWLGLAPLASPESLSEISSISSRTSNHMSLAASIEKCLQRISIQENINDILGIEEDDIRTPVIMRRAPKFTENLSTCADDWRSVDSYKRMGKVFITRPFGQLPNNNSDSSDLSFETASNLSRGTVSGGVNANGCENSKSADNLDADMGYSDKKLGELKLTQSDSLILRECNSNCPNCPCRYSITSCCQLKDHRDCVPSNEKLFDHVNLANFNMYVMTNNSSSSDTYYSALSSLTGFDAAHDKHNNEQADSIIQIKPGVLESHFPVYNFDENFPMAMAKNETNTSTKSNTNINNNNSGSNQARFLRNGSNNQSSKSSTIAKKRNTSDDKQYSKNESLPLLTNLCDKSSSSSSPTNYVKRKRNIYPIDSGVKVNRVDNSMHKNESNV